jgi:hypothetical protein
LPRKHHTPANKKGQRITLPGEGFPPFSLCLPQAGAARTFSLVKKTICV